MLSFKHTMLGNVIDTLSWVVVNAGVSAWAIGALGIGKSILAIFLVLSMLYLTIMKIINVKQERKLRELEIEEAQIRVNKLKS